MVVDVFSGVDEEKRVEALARSQRMRSAAITAKGRATDRRNDENRPPQDAITSFCSECITGYGLDIGGHGSLLAAVVACPATECHLWPWRRGRMVFDEEGNVI
jgi:hypothetical protein